MLGSLHVCVRLAQAWRNFHHVCRRKMKSQQGSGQRWSYITLCLLYNLHWLIRMYLDKWMFQTAHYIKIISYPPHVGPKSGVFGCQSRREGVMDQCFKCSHHQGQESHIGWGKLDISIFLHIPLLLAINYLQPDCKLAMYWPGSHILDTSIKYVSEYRVKSS